MTHRDAVHAPAGLDRLPAHADLRRRRRSSSCAAEGTELWDADGKRYLDFLSGLAVTSLGHSHPAVAEALYEQAQTLLHVSNLFATPTAAEVAITLDRPASGGRRAGVLLQQRRRGQRGRHQAGPQVGRPRPAARTADGRYVVVSAYGSLPRPHAGHAARHRPAGQARGRSSPCPRASATWPGTTSTRSPAAIDPTRRRRAARARAGRGRREPRDRRATSAACGSCATSAALLFMVDEVQTGLGRTGAWFAHQHFGVVPDVVTMAKALGNGVPIGACWAKREVAAAFEPGDHATTFGGTPIATGGGQGGAGRAASASTRRPRPSGPAPG